MPKKPEITKETRLLKVTITGTQQDIKNQFKVLSSYVNTEVTDYTTKLKSLQAGIDALMSLHDRGKALTGIMQRELEECLEEHKKPDKEIEKKVKNIIMEWLRVREGDVTPEASLSEDLGGDSLDTVEVVMALEEEFGIEIPDEEGEKFKIVRDAIEYINKVTKEDK